MFDFSAAKTRESFEKSLELLNVDYVDVIQIHDVEFCASLDQIVNHTLPTLKKFKDQGKARYIGITGYDLSVLAKIVEKAEPGTIDTVLSYCRMNLTNQGMYAQIIFKPLSETISKLVSDLLHYMDFFKERGVGVINASAISMGLLAGPACPKWHTGLTTMGESAMKAYDYCQSKGVKLREFFSPFFFFFFCCCCCNKGNCLPPLLHNGISLLQEVFPSKFMVIDG